MPGPPTVPLPVTDTVTVGSVAELNVAMTVWLAASVRTQAPVPEQPPLQPVKLAPAPATAIRFTMLPPGKLSLQSPGHEMPGPLTVPLPATVTVSVGWAADVNVAVTARLPVRVSVHG